MGEREPLTVQELLDVRSLGLQAVVLPQPEIEVSGAHTSEIHEPGRWFDPGNIMLTTGLRLEAEQGRDQVVADLAAAVRRARVSALCFGLGIYFEQVPQELVEACRDAEVNLLTVARDVPFTHVEKYVNALGPVAEDYGMKRAMWLTNDLLDSIASDQPIASLIQRVAANCRGAAMLYEDTGKLVESNGDGPVHLVLQAITNHGVHYEKISIGRWQVMYRTIVMRGRGYHLAIASRNEQVLAEVGDVLLDTTQKMLGAIKGLQHLDASRRRHENSQLLTSLQDGIEVSRELRYWELVKPFGFESYQPVRSVAAVVLHDGSLGPRRVEMLLASAQRAGVPLLFAENGRSNDIRAGFNALIPDTRQCIAWLGEQCENLAVGLGEASGSLSRIPELLRGAELAAKVALRDTEHQPGGEGLLLRADDLDPATWMLARIDSPLDRQRLVRFIAPLREEPELEDTLVAYLALDQDISRTASQLFVHQNTVRYRIKKAAELLGGNMAEARLVAGLYLSYERRIIDIRNRQRAGSD
ncbi:helix-turn-helix domain-containing protein [Glutamicibacter protophormiae]|uniref:helix-turn-helix domain-containing protein n=1 Tax=Glutamicibacter protophormiae TaxID=37930 RepID=UPI001EF4EC82|nr:PucR family transcriptional regulator [Glutamicibacter protophormiae]